jgi:hypothetical protein
VKEAESLELVSLTVGHWTSSFCTCAIWLSLRLCYDHHISEHLMPMDKTIIYDMGWLMEDIQMVHP